MQRNNQTNKPQAVTAETQTLINQLAFKSFRIWTRIAKRQIPGFPHQEIDERSLCKDFKTVIYDAFRSAQTLYGDSSDWYQRQKIFGYIDGFVQGKIANRWSFIYFPPPAHLDYLIWFQSFRMYARIHEETRIRVNRLYTHLKNKYQTLGHFLQKPMPGMTHVDLDELHVLSDLKADIHWKNFEVLFEKFFPESINRMIADFPRTLFPESTRLFTPKELGIIYEDWLKQA